MTACHDHAYRPLGVARFDGFTSSLICPSVHIGFYSGLMNCNSLLCFPKFLFCGIFATAASRNWDWWVPDQVSFHCEQQNHFPLNFVRSSADDFLSPDGYDVVHSPFNFLSRNQPDFISIVASIPVTYLIFIWTLEVKNVRHSFKLTPHIVWRRFKDHPADFFCLCCNNYLAFLEEWK